MLHIDIFNIVSVNEAEDRVVIEIPEADLVLLPDSYIKELANLRTDQEITVGRDSITLAKIEKLTIGQAGMTFHLLLLPSVQNSPMSVNNWCREVHEYAKEKGWWDGTPRTALEIHMLCVSEIAEATEAVREKKPDVYVHNLDGSVAEVTHMAPESFVRTDGETSTQLKVEGEATELADCVIRIFDYFGYKGWDLEAILQAKHAYNKTRPYKHGGKAL